MRGHASLGGMVLGLVSACAAPAPGDGAGDDGAANTGSGESGMGSESSTDHGTSTTTEDGDETGMPPGPDLAGAIDCDIWEPACDPDQKCTAYASEGSAWDANKCVDIMGDGQPGEPCVGLGPDPGVSGLDDCDAGSMCWDLDPDTSVGYCIAFCQGSPNAPACAPGTTCAIYNNGVLPVCLIQCDPLAPECPGEDDACMTDPGGTGFVCVDVVDSNGGYGDDCTKIAACDQGLFCADGSAVPGCMTDGCCSPFCDTSEANTCPGKDEGQVCVPWYEQGQAPPGYENVGGCAVP